jgi:hypothetical protein
LRGASRVAEDTTSVQISIVIAIFAVPQDLHSHAGVDVKAAPRGRSRRRLGRLSAELAGRRRCAALEKI